MLSGVINAAFSYISASNGGTGTRSGGPAVPCSTEGRSTAMSQTTEPSRDSLLLRDTPQDQHRFKNSPGTNTTTTGLLDQLLLFDEQITSSIGIFVNPKTPSQHIVRNICKVLEISGHGVPWFCICGLLVLLYFYSSNRILLDYGLNMFIVLIVDVLVVAPVKILFKRPRPHLNIGSIPLSVSSVDNYAFPSGHASRCVALAAYFCYMPPFNPWTHLWYIWGLLVSLSRVALCRHHVLDVGVGMMAGLVIFDIVRRSGLLLGV